MYSTKPNVDLYLQSSLGSKWRPQRSQPRVGTARNACCLRISSSTTVASHHIYTLLFLAYVFEIPRSLHPPSPAFVQYRFAFDPSRSCSYQRAKCRKLPFIPDELLDKAYSNPSPPAWLCRFPQDFPAGVAQFTLGAVKLTKIWVLLRVI